jgi:release factor glutamine methyltransferase
MGGVDPVIIASVMTEPVNLADRGEDQASIHALLEHGCAVLGASSDSPRLDAELLLACSLRRPRGYLYAHPERRLEPAVTAQFQALLLRRARGEPLAYLTGEREFWSLPLQVSADVLIPRPETELLVERCLALRPQPEGSIAELGTGSGAIALALALARPQWRIVATDLASAALCVCALNAQRLGVHRLELLQGDWLAPLSGRRFELIASNPPYIAATDPALQALRYEPRSALVSGADGLTDLRRIVADARAHLLPGGALVLEHGSQQAGDVAQALVAAGYARVRCYRDLAGHERVTEALWP